VIPVSTTRGDAFEELARAVHRPVLRYLLRRTGPTTAAEVLSEVLTVLWRRFDDLPVIMQSGRGDLTAEDAAARRDPRLAWCYGGARTCLANAQRGARRRDRLAARIALLDPPAQVAPQDALGSDRADGIRTALARLRLDDAELLRLWPGRGSNRGRSRWCSG